MEVMKIMYLCYCLFSPLATFLQKDHSRFAFRTHNLILLRGSVACPKRGFPPFPSQCYVATPGNGGGGFVSRLHPTVHPSKITSIFGERSTFEKTTDRIDRPTSL